MSTKFTQTIKQTKSSPRPNAEEVFSQHPQHQRSSSMPLGDSQPKPYTVFIAELISAFDSLTKSSTAPSSSTSSTLHTFFEGADHEAHVDSHQLKQVVRALQNADPAKISEVIAYLKAMPDPSTDRTEPFPSTKAKTSSTATSDKILKTNTKEAMAKTLTKKQREEHLDEGLEEWEKVEKSLWRQKSNDQLTGGIDPESCKSPLSPLWLFSSTASPSPEPIESKDATPPKNPRLRRSLSTGFGLSARSKVLVDPSWLLPRRKRTLSSGEQIAKAAASLLTKAATSKPREIKAAPIDTGKTSNLHRQSSMPLIRNASLKALLPTSKASLPDGRRTNNAVAVPEPPQSTSFLVSTFNSITRQFLPSQKGPPSSYSISIYTYWWGYDIYIPHRSMETIQRLSNTTSTFFNILTSTISGVPGLSFLVPIAQIIAAWVGHQWSAMKAEDRGKGVVISAVWILPVILAITPWDLPCCDHSSPPQLTTQRKKTILSKIGI
ncbi:MAG: hypothetical protein J3Q66DRAFT_182710 [Benniella sp.]|nr:MAG: hypothetical protein J3Q66DRAFT_182710 [Benniella sp.]